MVKHNKWQISHEGLAERGPNTLIIYTGGTLGMIFDNTKETLVPFSFDQLLHYLPEIKRVKSDFTIIEFESPIDSSNMNPQIWLDIAKLIELNYNDHSGFVVLHGTDTMAYTGSALSFLLKNLAKPVILTGAQLPIGIARSDARENLITALEIAAIGSDIHEVCIYFNGKLLRANRSKKNESELFDAFVSENYPLLGEVGVTIQFNSDKCKVSNTNQRLEVQKMLDANIFILKLFPGVSINGLLEFILKQGIKAVVLETFGAGNAPSNDEFLEFVLKLGLHEILVLNVSQCTGGAVNQESYATGKGLKELGVISGSDITIEAAVTKLMYLLAQNLSFESLKTTITKDLRGEIS